MAKKIVILQGHPDPQGEHLCHALAAAYEAGARQAGYDVNTVNIATLEFPLLRDQKSWMNDDAPASLQEAQRRIAAADHLVVIFPLWLGDMPAVLKGFFEQVFRPGFAFSREGVGMGGPKPLGGKSARIIVTMGMPGFFYRAFFWSHSVKNLKRNILQFIGIRPVRTTLVGMVEKLEGRRLEKRFEEMKRLGAAAR